MGLITHHLHVYCGYVTTSGMPVMADKLKDLINRNKLIDLEISSGGFIGCIVHRAQNILILPDNTTYKPTMNLLEMLFLLSFVGKFRTSMSQLCYERTGPGGG